MQKKKKTSASEIVTDCTFQNEIVTNDAKVHAKSVFKMVKGRPNIARNWKVPETLLDLCENDHHFLDSVITSDECSNTIPKTKSPDAHTCSCLLGWKLPRKDIILGPLTNLKKHVLSASLKDIPEKAYHDTFIIEIWKRFIDTRRAYFEAF